MINTKVYDAWKEGSLWVRTTQRKTQCGRWKTPATVQNSWAVGWAGSSGRELCTGRSLCNWIRLDREVKTNDSQSWMTRWEIHILLLWSSSTHLYVYMRERRHLTKINVHMFSPVSSIYSMCMLKSLYCFWIKHALPYVATNSYNVL